MNRPDIDAIEQRAKAASEGPWRYSTCYGVATIEAKNGSVADNVEYLKTGDADFITNARQDIPDLIAYVRKLEARILAHNQRMDRLVDEFPDAITPHVFLAMQKVGLIK